MRVLIDLTYERRAPLSGTGVYVRELCRRLRTLPGVELITVANAARRQPAGGGLGSGVNLLADVRWAALTLPWLARRHRAEVIHHPLPAISPVAGVPQVVTIADLAFERLPECFDPRFRRFAHLVHRAAARRAAAVICVSATTASDAQELWGLEPGRMVVALHGPGQVEEAVTARRGSAAGNPGEPGDRRNRGHPPAPAYFLYVGDAEPRKNLPVLLEAYARYRQHAERPLNLVLAGSAEAAAPGVLIERAPSPERLRRLIEDATALVHPSLYEGFGLTVAEAMYLGTPVLAARAPGVLEIGAGALLLAEPRDPVAFAAAMAELAQDAGLRERLSSQGRRRARDFSWSACARAHVDAYSLAVGS